MTTEHATSVISTRFGSGESAYRCLCSCGFTGRRYPSDKRVLAEDDAARHASYVADVARLIGKGQGR